MKKVQKGYIKRVFTKNCLFWKKKFGQKQRKILTKKTVFLEKGIFFGFLFFWKKKYFFELFWGREKKFDFSFVEQKLFCFDKKSTKMHLEPRLSIE